MDRIVIVIGPTAVGKTKLGVELAKEINGEIISMDSMQVYTELDILTNKVTTEEAQDIPHHLISEVDCEHQFNASQFVVRADELIRQIRSRGKIPILVGGTCYYAFNFLVRRKQLTREDDSVRRSSIDFLERQKQKYDEARNSKNERNLGELLEQLDPKAYALTKHNPKKFITYLESYFSTGLTIEEVNKLYKVHHQNALFLWITSKKSVLDQRIDDRAESMVTAGLKSEIVGLIEKRPKFDFTKSQFASIGLRQLMPLVNPNCTKEIEAQCIARLKSITKKYASNQERYIRQKFCHQSRFPGLPKLYQLDASDLTRWGENVAEKGVEAAKDYLSGKAIKLKVASETEVKLSSEDYYTDRVKQNTIQECAACNVQIIQSQFDVHLKSKRHKKRLEGIAKRKKNDEKRRKLSDNTPRM